jgi:hypothetical protein
MSHGDACSADDALTTTYSASSWNIWPADRDSGSATPTNCWHPTGRSALGCQSGDDATRAAMSGGGSAGPRFVDRVGRVVARRGPATRTSQSRRIMPEFGTTASRLGSFTLTSCFKPVIMLIRLQDHKTILFESTLCSLPFYRLSFLYLPLAAEPAGSAATGPSGSGCADKRLPVGPAARIHL